MSREEIIAWLESPAGERWSRGAHTHESRHRQALAVVKGDSLSPFGAETYVAVLWYCDRDEALHKVDPTGTGHWKYA